MGIKTNPCKTIVLGVISRFLDVVPPNHRSIPMVVIAGVSREIDFPKELLLMMLQFSDHFGRSLLFRARVTKIEELDEVGNNFDAPERNNVPAVH